MSIVKSTMKYADVNLGFVEGVLNKLGGIEGAERFLRGEFILTQSSVVLCIVDGNAEPLLQKGCIIVEHDKQGNLTLKREGDNLLVNGRKIEFYLSEDQQKGHSISGYKLQKELAMKPVLNSNLLDGLLANPELIPESYKKDADGETRLIYFWGTVYRTSSGFLCVRYLYWGNGEWRWSNRWVGGDWFYNQPAALLAS